MEIVTGPPVVGEKFFGREKELQRMYEKITKTDASLFIPGPRRIGKTSLVKEFIRQYKDEFNFLYFNIQGKNSVVELCEDLIDQLHEKFPKLIKTIPSLTDMWNPISEMFSQVKLGNFIDIKLGQLSKNTKNLLNTMEKILEKLTEKNVIIVMDEFSDFLINLKRNDTREVESFLTWLRDLRQQNKIRLIITGSINVLSTARDMNVVDLINDLTDIDILQLSDVETRELLVQLLSSNGIKLEENPLQYAVEKLNDGIPFYIQLFADGVSQYTNRNSQISEEKDIKELYNRITNKSHKEFENFHSRLTVYLNSIETNVAHTILAHLANNPLSFEELYSYSERLMPDKKKFHRTISRLVDENYIKSESNKYSFVSPMLKDWWKNRYGWEKE